MPDPERPAVPRGKRRDTAESLLAKDIYSLLNEPCTEKTQYFNEKQGKWTYGAAHEMRESRYVRHFLGAVCIAIAAVNGGEANFLLWDVDVGFPQRRLVIADLLRQRGWDKASFCTTGSDSGRGKVITCLAQRIPQYQAAALAATIKEGALGDWRFGAIADPKDFSAFPVSGQGGHVRIAGRNVGRDGPMESVLDLDGKPLDDLSHLQPVYIEEDPSFVKAIPKPKRRSGDESATLSELDRILSQPCAEDSNKIFADICFVARQYVRDGSVTEAEGRLREACKKIQANSPGLKPSRVAQLSRDDVIARAMTYALQPRKGRWSGDWEQLTPETYTFRPQVGAAEPTPLAWRVYNAIADECRECGGNPNAFCMDYGRIKKRGDFKDKYEAQKGTNEAQDSHLLFRMSRGEPVRGGLVTFHTLACGGQTLQDAFDLAATSQEWQDRLATLVLKGRPLPDSGVVEGRIVRQTSRESVRTAA